MPGRDAGIAAIFALANAVAKSLELAQTEVLRPHSISLVEYQVLASLYLGPPAEEGLSPRSLNTLLRQSSAAMTQILTRLEKAGLLARHPNPQDRRSVTIRLTHEGEATTRNLCDTMAVFQKKCLAGLQASQKTALKEDLQLLLTRLT